MATEALLSDDQALVRHSQAGDTRAFSELLQRHDDAMRGVVWRLVASSSAMDDILQDAYLKAWRRIGDFRGDAAFSSWLYRIVHSTTLDHVKAQSRRRIVPLESAPIVSVDDKTGAFVESESLRAALAQLPEDQLAVVTLVDGQGRSYEAVAEMLGIQPGTVGSRLSRARAALRKTLQSDFSDRGRGQEGRS